MGETGQTGRNQALAPTTAPGLPGQVVGEMAMFHQLSKVAADGRRNQTSIIGTVGGQADKVGMDTNGRGKSEEGTTSPTGSPLRMRGIRG